ncbi:MAG: hypothetical protein AB1689_05660, partial [Thermodesulfobacteriota bacterium]
MRKSVLAVALGALAVVLTAGSASAQYAYPKKGNKFQSTMVTAYAACAASNDTTTGAVPLPACHPAVPNDTVCGFDVTNPAKPLGQGQLQGVVTGKGATADVKLQVKLQGLNAGCIGQTLCIVPFVRASSQGCASGDPGGCTVLEALTNPFNIPGPGCGVVDAKGKLQIKTTVDTASGADIISGGNNLQLDLSRTGVRRTTGPSLPPAGT